MSTSIPIHMNGNGYGRVPSPPRWLWESVVLVAMAGMGGWMWNRANDDIAVNVRDIKAESNVNVTQGNTLINHEVRITANESGLQKIDGKLDRILEHLNK